MNAFQTLLAVACLHSACAAADALRPDHPLVGTWRLDFEDRGCHEMYTIHEDGTTLVTSAEEIAESEGTFSDQPSSAGFYRWQDKVVKDNGKPDCMGQVTQVGSEVTSYIRLNRAEDKFVLCRKEDLDECIGPLVKIPGHRI
jgi:hypothetical protein